MRYSVLHHTRELPRSEIYWQNFQSTYLDAHSYEFVYKSTQHTYCRTTYYLWRENHDGIIPAQNNLNVTAWTYFK